MLGSLGIYGLGGTWEQSIIDLYYMYMISEIEDKIITALQGSGLVDICKTISSYHGEIDDIVAEVMQLKISMPAALVLYGGSRFDETANRSFDDEMQFSIVFIAKDLRGRENLKTGIYAMLEAAKATLVDNDLGLNIEPLHPISIEAAMITKLFSIYVFDIKTSFSM